MKTRRLGVPIPDFTGWDVLWMGTILGLCTIGYGSTLAQRNPESVAFFDVIPVHGWTWLFIGAGAILLTGLAMRVHRIVWLGAGLIAVVWTTFTLGIVLDDWSRAPFYLSRNSLPILLAGMGWLRLGIFPDKSDTDDR